MKDETVHRIVHYMMIFMLVVAVIALVLFPDKEVHAEKLRLNLIVVDSPLSLPQETQVGIFKSALERLSEVEVLLKLLQGKYFNN